MKTLFPFLMASASAEEVTWETEAAPGYLETVFEQFAETPATTWIAAGVLVALALMLLLIGKTRKQWTAKTVAFAALSISLSFVLSLIRLYRMPSGGSVTPASMLPVMLFAAAFGAGPGVLAGAVLTVLLLVGALKLVVGAVLATVHPLIGAFYTFFFATLVGKALTMCLLDYVLAYAALGLCGLYKPLKKVKGGLYISMVFAVLFRLVSAALAGYMFWETAWWASVAYNGIYLIPDTLICMLLAVPLHKPVLRILNSK